MFAKKILPFVSFALLSAQCAAAQDKPEIPLPQKAGPALEQYGGVVVDLTTTNFGRQFYRRFVGLWQDNPLSDQYMIAIRERATARFGSQITVEYAQRRVYQILLPPSTNAIRAAGENAVAVVLENIMAIDVQRLMFRDEDLGTDEI
jgi:curli production assembly/transport component CsgE